jgi:hypothetical protein
LGKGIIPNCEKDWFKAQEALKRHHRSLNGGNVEEGLSEWETLKLSYNGREVRTSPLHAGSHV